MILIFTNKGDAHPTNVIRHLKEWGIPVFRFNTECFLSDYEFTWRCSTGSKPAFTLHNVRNGLTLRSEDVTAIWERRPWPPSQPRVANNNAEVNKHNLEEAHEALSWMRYALKDVFSIGGIVEDRFASSKMLGYAVAQSIIAEHPEWGMWVPDTCISGAPEEVRAFAMRHETVCLKPLSGNSVYVDDENEYAFYAQKVRGEDILRQPDEAICQTINFLQEYTPKAYELRVTAVCDETITCKIDSQSMPEGQGREDWRQGYDKGLRQEIVPTPPYVGMFCREYMQRLGLRMGCFDFIVTPEGHHVFLECNPNGQWLWIELETGADISGLIARKLSS